MFVNFIIIVTLVVIVKSAKILVVVPASSISHQIVYRPIIQELVDRDHEVTVITTDPLYRPEEAPRNLHEIDIHDLSYALWLKVVHELAKADHTNLTKMKIAYRWLSEIFIEQLKDKTVVNLIRDQRNKFDLLILQSFIPGSLIFSHFFKAPVIFMSPFGAFPGDMKIIGSESHPLLFPTHYHQKLYNLTVWDKISESYIEAVYNNLHQNLEHSYDRMLQSVFGSDTPVLNDLKSNVHLLYLNTHPIWLHNPPVTQNLVYTWGIRKTPEKKLPEELQTYLDSSKNGVIYMSFGSNFKTSEIPPKILGTFLKVFSQVPYNILWKWDADELPGKSDNIKISKWLPQCDVLRHPNLKLFITHGGLQSTHEAINAGVPLIGIPQFSDQEYNTVKYEYFKIGIKLDYKSLTTENLDAAIRTVVPNYDSYKQNVIHLRTLIYDQPMPPLEHAIWRIEHVLRHGGVQHLRAPAANMSWTEYYELELVVLVLTVLIFLGTVLLITMYICLLTLFRLVKSIIIPTEILNKYH